MSAEPLTPPIAKTVPYSKAHLGKTLHDPYRWLQDKNDPDVIAYLEAENAYARAALQPTAALQEQLYAELRGRIKEDDSTVPEQHGEYTYYWRVQEGQQYRLFCRKALSPDADEQILLDENALAEGLSYCRVAFAEPSPDNALLAYGVDVTGAWVFNLYILDMVTGRSTGPIPNTAWSVAWASDSRTLFYTLFDDAHRAYKLLRHRVGDDPNNDVLIYHEPDDAFMLDVERTRSGAFLLLTLRSMSTSEVHYLPADQPTGEFKPLHPRQPWVEYYATHHGERFLIWTNEDAENFKLLEAPTHSPEKQNWRAIIPHRPDVLLIKVEAFQDKIVLLERKDGLPQIGITAPDDLLNPRYVQFPEPVYSIRLAANPMFASDTLRFIYSSLITPESTVDYGMTDGSWSVRKVQVIPSGYDASQYTSERHYAPTVDGTLVPISLAYRKDIKLGENPLLLYGYGAYGYSMEATFDTNRLSLLDRGFVYAVAHIRGGSEMGRRWYEQGRLMFKKNTFTDFIACAEYLLEKGYAAPDKLGIMGGSAGGLLVSAVTNMRPDLFKAVVAMVPFTNLVTAMLMPELPLTVIEYEQWGHPNNPEAFDYMLSYSPYENVEAKAYPHLYVRAGLHDLQVPYWDPAKWVAKLRATKTDNNPLYLITNMGAGHSGASGRYDRLREIAEYYAFLITTLNA